MWASASQQKKYVDTDHTIKISNTRKDRESWLNFLLLIWVLVLILTIVYVWYLENFVFN